MPKQIKTDIICMITNRTVRTKTTQIPPKHPQWANINIDNILHKLADKAGGEPEDYQLIHAWANLIYHKDGQVYKITPEARTKETTTAYNVTRHIIKQHLNFPLPAVTPNVAPYAITADANNYVITCWQYMPLEGISEKQLEETSTYEWLGHTVGILHTTTNIKTLKLPHYDPLRWTNQRIRRLTDLRYPRSKQLQCEAHQLKRTLDTLTTDLPNVLLHGDIHLDNIAINTDTGQYILTDYESACIGPAIGDLYPSAGWIKRTGKPSEKQREIYWQSYLAETQKEPWDINEEIFKVLDNIGSLSQFTWRLLNERIV